MNHIQCYILEIQSPITTEGFLIAARAIEEVKQEIKISWNVRMYFIYACQWKMKVTFSKTHQGMHLQNIILHCRASVLANFNSTIYIILFLRNK